MKTETKIKANGTQVPSALENIAKFRWLSNATTSASSATTIAVKAPATKMGRRPPLRRNRCAVTAAKMIGAPTACAMTALGSDTLASSAPMSAPQAAQPTTP